MRSGRPACSTVRPSTQVVARWPMSVVGAIWPFPKQAIAEAAEQVRAFVSVELSMGQMIQDVKVAAMNRWPVKLIHRTGGIVPSSIEIADRTMELLKEVKA